MLERFHTELRRIAGALMKNQASDHTLQAKTLVNEAFLRLLGSGEQQVNDLYHWVMRAARAMRSALIDHERIHRAGKRGGDCLQVSIPSGADS